MSDQWDIQSNSECFKKNTEGQKVEYLRTEKVFLKAFNDVQLDWKLDLEKSELSKDTKISTDENRFPRDTRGIFVSMVG